MPPKYPTCPGSSPYLGHTPSPYDNTSDNVVERIKRYRQTHGLSQKKFAKLIGVDVTTVAKWERKKHMPSKKTH